MGLEEGPLCLVSAIEELLERKSGGSGLEYRAYSRRGRPRWLRDTLYSLKLELTSPKSGGRSVGIVCSQTKATSYLIVDYRLCISWILYQQLWGYKFEEEVHLEVREQKMLNTASLEDVRLWTSHNPVDLHGQLQG
jgi:hypothetical protein